MTPVIKWAGGKTQLLPELMKRMPRTWNRYVEPFAGGAALFFALTPADAILADVNHDLIGLYKQLADDPEPVIRGLRRHQRQHRRAYYYQIRDRYNDATIRWRPGARAAAFVYLNKTAFKGLHRVNKAGHFNVPMGDYKRPTICDPTALREAATALRRAQIRCSSYQKAIASATAGDFVYFDPPYDPVSTTAAFTSYAAGGFSRDDQRELARVARELVSRGAFVMLSNSNTRFIRSLYRDPVFTIDRVSCRRSINARADRRGAVAEVIITGKLATRWRS